MRKKINKNKCSFCGKGQLNPNQQRRDEEGNTYCIKCSDMICSKYKKGVYTKKEADDYKEKMLLVGETLNLFTIKIKKFCMGNLFKAKETYAFIKEQVRAEENYSIEHHKKTRNCLTEEEYIKMTKTFINNIPDYDVSIHSFSLNKEVNKAYTKNLGFINNYNNNYL